MTTITVEELEVEGAPQAGVTIAGLNSGTQVISVQVSWDDGETYNPVSGGTRLTTVGGAFVRDYFCPLNVPAVWTLAADRRRLPSVGHPSAPRRRNGPLVLSHGELRRDARGRRQTAGVRS